MKKETLPVALWVMLAFVVLAGAAWAQEFKGVTVITPTSTTTCRVLTPKTKYMVQARVTAQDYTYSQYMFSSIEVFNSHSRTIATVGAMPTDGGFVGDGGVFFQIREPIILKDTDTFSFTALTPDSALCYKAGVTADGGVSAMKLGLHEIVR